MLIGSGVGLEVGLGIIAQIPTSFGKPSIPLVPLSKHSSPGAQSISPQQVGVPWFPENIAVPTSLAVSLPL